MSFRKKTLYPGVRYREHPTRKHNGKPDRYYFIRYRIGGKQKEEGLGWGSSGWSAKKVSLELAKLKEAHAKAEGPQTLAEKRLVLKEQNEAEQAEKERHAKEQITFTQFFNEEYFPQAKLNKSPRSYKRELSLFKLWINPIIGNTALNDVTLIQLEKIKKNMAKAGRSARSIRYALATIRQVFNYARRNDLYNDDPPTSKVKMPQKDNNRLRFLTHKEAKDLLEALKTRSPQVYEMALLSLFTGMRAGEIFSLTWGEVDIERGVLTLRDTKSGHSRVVFINQDIKDMLGQKTRGGIDEFVFVGREGIKIQAISKSFKRAVEELGLNDGVTDPRQKICFHSLRHTFASWLVERGVDLYTVKELLGHSTLALTERYSHLGNDTLQQAVKILETSISHPNKLESSKPKKSIWEN